MTMGLELKQSAKDQHLQGERDAMVFAHAAHAAVGQKRKFTGQDYIVHPLNVAHIAREYLQDAGNIRMAYLHDVLEDTQVEYQHLIEIFGVHIAAGVMTLTTMKHEDEKRADRVQREADRLSMAIPDIQTIKCADIIHNTTDLALFEPQFAKQYCSEKQITLDAMTGAHEVLRRAAYAKIRSWL